MRHPVAAPQHPVGVDAYGLLDHRTRESTLLEDVAPPGRYLALEHDGRTWLIALSRPITHIGRGLVADVRLEDPHVSRRHAIIAIRGDGPDAVRVLDDRSSGGTFVNGTPVTVAQLHEGDIVRVGRVWSLHRDRAGGQAPADASPDPAERRPAPGARAARRRLSDSSAAGPARPGGVGMSWSILRA